jgi:hypothetical protein
LCDLQPARKKKNAALFYPSPGPIPLFSVQYQLWGGDLLALFSIVYEISMALGLVAGGIFLVENSGPYERMHLFPLIISFIQYQLFLGI